jgi:hypothetical protein
MRWSSAPVRVAALVGLLASCGASSPGFPYFYVTAAAGWPAQIDSVQAFGYRVDVKVTKKMDGDGNCNQIPEGVRVLVDGVEASFGPDAAAGCMEAKLTLGPFLQSHAVTALVERDGETVGHASFDGLLPGLGAVLLRPADGQIQAGDDIVVRPLPELPAESAIAHFYPLDGPSWIGAGTYAVTARLLDGVHVLAPAFSGRAWLAVGTSDAASAEVSCQGFAACSGTAAAVLGPFLVTEQP